MTQPKLRRLIKPVLENRKYKKTIEKALRAVGYEPTDWVRTVMYRECYKFIEGLGPENLDVLEISAGERFSERFRFRSFVATQFPEFDVCSQVLSETFDLIIADQVFEHLRWPYRAGKNIYAMMRAGGHLLVATPFLIRVHNVPIDCSRWTELGLKCLLAECGFSEESIKTGSWGNRPCVKSNLYQWTKTGWFGSLKNEPDFPVMVWALAQKI